jgi:hypothetical protein
MLSNDETYAATSDPDRSPGGSLASSGCPTLRLRPGFALAAVCRRIGQFWQAGINRVVLKLNFKGNQVLYICNSRGRPGCTLGFLFFRPGAHGPTQYCLRTLHVNGDPAGV